MNDHDQKKSPEAGPQDEAVPGADAAADYAARNAAHYAAEAAEDGAEAMPEDAIATLQAEKADLTDRYVRLAAEMENLRKRTERELGDARKYAVTRFAADILSVSDNLGRAKDSAGQGDGALEAIVEGIDVTARDLARILEKHGVVKIPAEGEKFDPNLHQAMFEVPDESVPSGTVVQQIQEGYMIGDRVLRAAMVGVSRGGPKQPAAAGEEPQQAAKPDGQTDTGAGGTKAGDAGTEGDDGPGGGSAKTSF